MIIGDTTISSLDFPDKMSFVIFMGGCALKCPYCHNPEIIDGGKAVGLDEIFGNIEDSIDFIDGVVVTGGEPLIQYNDVKKILEYSKMQNLATKLDTNGCFPERLKKIIDLVDYVALDIKAPFPKYKKIIGSNIGNDVKKSMEICLSSPDTYLECRTTYVPALMDRKDIIDIARSIKCDIYTIQQFRDRNVLDKRLYKTPVPKRDELKEIAEDLKPFLKNVKIKTSEFGDEFMIRSGEFLV